MTRARKVNTRGKGHSLLWQCARPKRHRPPALTLNFQIVQ
jgi:hypothetical protein